MLEAKIRRLHVRDKFKTRKPSLQRCIENCIKGGGINWKQNGCTTIITCLSVVPIHYFKCIAKMSFEVKIRDRKSRALAEVHQTHLFNSD